jgi:hypothetical protein
LVVASSRRCGIPWEPAENCQDSLSRIISGRSGSFQRDGIVGLGLLVAGLFVAGNLPNESGPVGVICGFFRSEVDNSLSFIDVVEDMAGAGQKRLDASISPKYARVALAGGISFGRSLGNPLVH